MTDVLIKNITPQSAINLAKKLSVDDPVLECFSITNTTILMHVKEVVRK